MRPAQRGLALAFALIATLLAGLSPAAAQLGSEDSGTFEVFLQGRRVGTEDFTIRQTGAGGNSEVIATGRVQILLPTGDLQLEPRLRARGFEASPVSYEVAIGGTSPRTIVGTIGSGRFSARIITPSGEQLREYVASNGAIVLDEGVAHHYYLLARRTRSGRVPILIPRENRQVMAEVEDLGEAQVEVAGTRITAYHVVVRPANGDERHVWVDSLGRVLQVEIPTQAYRASRTQVPR